jgi:hypothetical protein
MTAPTADQAADLPRGRPPPGQRMARRAWESLRDAAARAGGRARAVPGAMGAEGRELFRKLADRDPARALSLVRRAKVLAPGLAGAEAVLVARAHGWAAAAPLVRALDPAQASGAGVLRGRPAPALDPALPDPRRPAALPPEVAARLVVYTASFGDAPPPAPVFQDVPGLRFLWLTDRSAEVAGWERAKTDPPGPDPAAWCRILPHRALAEAAPEAEASLWLGPDRRLVGNPHTLLARWCLPHALVLWRHGHGIDWQDLAEHHLTAGGAPGDREAVLAQAEDCAARALPRDQGAWDTGMIWRRHGAAEVAALMEAWWAAFARAPGLDAIALYAALNDPAAAAGPAGPRTLPAALGSAEDNIFAGRVPRPPRPARPAAARSGKLGVAFLYAEEYARSATTFLRGRQLSELVAERCGDRFEVSYTSDAAALRDRVVIVTKGALEVLPAAAIARIARANIAAIGCWDDLLPEADKVAATSASMTVAHRQTVDFGRLYPATPVFHVTHHVNREIRPGTPPADRLRTGYFGFLRNTYRPESLARMVDLIGISTSQVEMSWIDALPRYNAHWVVRRRAKAWDGWKPFLKGFVAARCGAVVVAGRGDDDALQYLGDDYPFFVGGTDPDTLEYDMARIAAAFGGPEWELAQAIMAQVGARSTDAVVAAEFRAMVEEVAG